jgi:hypothetical protein
VDAFRSRAEAAEDELARATATASALAEEGRRWGEVLATTRARHVAEAAEAGAILRAREDELAALRAELASRPTAAEVATLRSQLSALQAMHVSDGTDTGEGAGGQGGDGGSGGGDAPHQHQDGGTGEVVDVHTLMLRRIRQLEGKVIHADTARGNAESQAATLSEQLEAALGELADAKALLASLEDQLSRRLASAASGGGGSGGVVPGSARALPWGSPPGTTADDERGHGGSPGGGRHGVAMSADGQLHSILGGADFASPPPKAAGVRPAQPATPGEGVPFSSPALAASDDGAGGGMVAILQGQRDRFRARMLALEADVQARDAQVADAAARVARLTADNVRLYEKTRYLQSMASGPGGGGGGDTGVSASMRDVEAAPTPATRPRPQTATSAAVPEEDFERPYRRMYDESLDPFAAFGRREQARTYARLSRADKITLKSSRFILGNKFARSILFFYFLALHLLVFATLWHFAHVTHRGGECGGSGLDEPGGAGGVPAGLARPGPGALRGGGGAGGGLS